MGELVHLYDPNMPFKHCSCPECVKINYAIKHSPQPLDLPERLVKAIEVLLWYSPNNINSSQSVNNDYLSDSAFDDAIMTYFIRYMGMKSEDIHFIQGTTIDQTIITPYLGSACVPCRKIIVAQRSESKIDCIFHHMRNCLAHGRFNFLTKEDIIGFDALPGGKPKYTALFKMNINNLYEFCMQLLDFTQFTISHIFQYYFLKNGYNSIVGTMGHIITREGTREDEELVFAKKGNTAYRINCSRYRKCDPTKEFEEFENHIPLYIEGYDKQTKFIDVFYTEYSIGHRRQKNDSTFLLDKDELKNLLQNNNPNIV